MERVNSNNRSNYLTWVLPIDIGIINWKLTFMHINKYFLIKKIYD